MLEIRNVPVSMLEIINVVQTSAERMPMPVCSDIFLNLSDGKEMASYLICSLLCKYSVYQ